MQNLDKNFLNGTKSRIWIIRSLVALLPAGSGDGIVFGYFVEFHFLFVHMNTRGWYLEPGLLQLDVSSSCSFCTLKLNIFQMLSLVIPIRFLIILDIFSHTNWRSFDFRFKL